MRIFSHLNEIIKNNLVLIIIILTGLILRVVGTNPGYFAHGDEIMYGEAIYMLQNKTLGMEPHILGYYPPLVAWIMLISFLIIFIPTDVVLNFPRLLGKEITFNKLLLLDSVYWGRYTTVIISTGTIALTYFLTYRIFKNKFTACLSSLFVAVNYRLVLNSKIGFLDIYGVFFLLLALLSIIELFERPTFKNYLLSSVSVGLSFLVKYQIFALPPFLLIHFLKNYKSHNFLNKGFLVGVTFSSLLILISHYYHFLNWEKVRGLFEYQALKYGLGIYNLNIFPVSYIYHIILGPILSFAGLGGLIFGLTQKRYRVKILAIGLSLLTAAFIYFFYSSGGTYTRNLLPIIPLALIFSSYFFVSIWQKTTTAGKVVLIVIIFFGLKDQLVNSLISDQVLYQPSGRFQVEEWIKKYVPQKKVIGTYQGTYTPDQKKFSILFFPNINEVLSFRELEAEKADYEILDLSSIGGSFVWWMGQPTDIGLKFWEKPDNLLSQGYNAMAARELLWKSTVNANLPKWQVQGYNYALFKIEKESFKNFITLKKFTFENGREDWNKILYFNQTKNLLNFKDNGYKDKGELSIEKETIKKEKIKRILAKPGALRWESSPLPAKDFFEYKISAWIKNEESLEKSKRNGFIRLDFYRDRPTGNFDEKALQSFVSERVYGENKWHQVIAEGIAPEGSKFLTIGFQADQTTTNLSLDNVEVSVTDEKTIDDGPHITIPDSDLFPPNDGGFL